MTPAPAPATSVRPAVPADAPAVAGVYNEGITGRAATFETEPPTPAQMAGRIAAAAPPHAFLVAERTGRVIGWAATSPYSSRSVYAGVAEFSVYIAGDTRGAGAGRALLTALLAHAEGAGLHKLTSRVFPENAASRALCAACGFREAGTLARHARLDGAWRDVIVVERLLGPALTDPDQAPSASP